MRCQYLLEFRVINKIPPPHRREESQMDHAASGGKWHAQLLPISAGDGE